MKLTSAFLAVCVIPAAFVAPSISTSAAEPARPRPDVLILERLKDVGLSGAQTAAIKKLSAENDSLLADLEAKAAPTQAQRAARDQALRKVIAEGKRGAEARPIIAAAFALTNEQRRAVAQIGIVRDEFNRSVFSLLTETQKILLAASAHRLAGYTGFIGTTARRSPALARASIALRGADTWSRAGAAISTLAAAISTRRTGRRSTAPAPRLPSWRVPP